MIEIACVGQPWPARRIFSSGCAAGSTTIATPSSSRSNTPGAQNEQFPEPMQASRLISISSATARRVTGVTTTEKPKLHWKKSETHGLLPDPEPREIKYTIVSVDDHLVEPPGMFEGRLPRRFQDRAPKIVETAEGHEVWEFAGQLYFQAGLNGVWASVNFPSQITGFCGRVFSQAYDPDLGLAVTQAWNDWFAEEWHAPYPERIVPMG